MASKLTVGAETAVVSGVVLIGGGALSALAFLLLGILPIEAS